MHRYFMSINEACQLVLQAASIGAPSEALVLDMGELVRVETIARRYAELSGAPNVDVVYTGVRSGEKLREARLGTGERDERPHHRLITHVQVPPLPADAVAELAHLRRSPQVSDEEILTWLKQVGSDVLSTAP